MSEKVLMKGNEAIAESAIRAGCGAYFGYPITPQNEIPAYMARHMLDRGRIFIQAESEIAAIIMVYGAACSGVRAMTSSSSPGISLKQEGLSYAAGADVPLVVANINRGGPGLGNIAPAQSDYYQSTRGGGHGDYRCIVLAPKNVQECADLTYLAFDLAEKYRMPVIIHADGMIGQMMEGCILPQEKTVQKYSWSAGGMANAKREAVHITSIELDPVKLEAQTKKRFVRYETVKAAEIRYEENNCADADMILVAYGTSARVCLGAQMLAKNEGIKLGVFRPITLWPFPYDALGKTMKSGKPVLTVEMSEGQLVEDVKLSAYYAGSNSDIHLLAHSGGIIPAEEEVFAKVKEILKK
ncbi:3-methyl-2-oxobutanoate dehydrogenase subunit VorB [Treponema sp. R6D11]